MEINQSQQIQIIGSIENNQQISLSSIEKTLSASQAILSHGDKFTGKPGTQIYTDENYVVKLHAELDFKGQDAERWIHKKLNDERQYELYVPSKTWFLLHIDGKHVIANITPLLRPLHQLACDENFLSVLQDMLDNYFRIAANFDKLLDGGLSNFALDANDRLYYLDDDIYRWDKFTAFCSQTGVLIRQLDKLSLQQWHQLGEFCHQKIIEYFHDKHQITIAYEQFKDIFMANDEQKKSLTSFLEGFYQAGNKSRSVAKAVKEKISADSSGASRIVIMADIHANLPALQAVINELEKQNVDSGIILGDVIGYGPHPEECINLLKQKHFTVVKGNHDHAIATGVFAGGFSATGRFVAEWSSGVISEENKQWLDHLPPYLRHNNWLAVHGSPMDKTFFNGYVYKMTAADNLDNLQQREIDICFHGHSHVQGVFYRAKKQDGFSNDREQQLTAYDQCLVCPGSVGQPRSNIAGAEFAIYDTKTSAISFFRIDYDLEKTMADMSNYNFPSQLIERLPLGK